MSRKRIVLFLCILLALLVVPTLLPYLLGGIVMPWWSFALYAFIVLVYAGLYLAHRSWLIDKYLVRGRKWAFLGWSVLLILVSIVLLTAAVEFTGLIPIDGEVSVSEFLGFGVMISQRALLVLLAILTVILALAVANDGSEVNFADYKGKVLLVVNTASKCGFTPQYDGLEALYQKYKDQGLVIIGFPCDQFGHQEPGTNEEIAEFCRLNYGVTFPLMDKVDVNGENAHPVFQWLYAEKPFSGFGDGDTARFMDGMLSRMDPDYASNPDIKWNFTKFLIDRKGRVVARFEPTVTPEQLESDVAQLL